MVTTWLLSVAALGIGSIGTYLIGLSADRRRLAADDERRWLNDRRSLYARFLSVIEQLEREADRIACFLPHDRHSPPLSADDDRLIREMSFEWITRWEAELQAMLTEIELMASPVIADLAVRASQGVLEAVPQVQHLGGGETRVTPAAYDDHWPVQQAAKDLCGVLRNAMRQELGLAETLTREPLVDADWPWLPDRPSPSKNGALPVAQPLPRRTRRDQR